MIFLNGLPESHSVTHFNPRALTPIVQMAQEVH